MDMKQKTEIDRSSVLIIIKYKAKNKSNYNTAIDIKIL